MKTLISLILILAFVTNAMALRQMPLSVRRQPSIIILKKEILRRHLSLALMPNRIDVLTSMKRSFAAALALLESKSDAQNYTKVEPDPTLEGISETAAIMYSVLIGAFIALILVALYKFVMDYRERRAEENRVQPIFLLPPLSNFSRAEVEDWGDLMRRVISPTQMVERRTPYPSPNLSPSLGPVNHPHFIEVMQ